MKKSPLKLISEISPLLPLIGGLILGIYEVARIESQLYGLESNQVEMRKIFDSHVQTQARADDKQSRMFFDYQKMLFEQVSRCCQSVKA
jgi:hypothetical protein